MTSRRTVVGLIADTHGLLRAEIATLFSDVELIVHAGDVGGGDVLDALSAIAPLEAVSGNVDDRHDPRLPLHRTIPVGGLTLHVSHGDEVGRPTPETLLARYDADIVVFGHTHKAIVVRQGARVAINPGAAGPRRFKLQPSVAILTVEGKSVDVQLLPL